ncbi:MAG: hypothetical protein J1F03_08150, partial [Oscillospiraceae bacterium]|nr:hypothetical protein [Oscillospiraceae bacterium]
MGDFTHPAICGFYIASYVKAVIFKNKTRKKLFLPRFCLACVFVCDCLRILCGNGRIDLNKNFKTAQS